MDAPIHELLDALSSAGVRYLVVGGVAVVMHGYLRATADLDLVIDFEPANLTAAIDLFEKRGFQPRAPVPLRAFLDPTTRSQWRSEKNMQVMSLWHPSIQGLEVDIFLEEPFSFAAAYDRRVQNAGISIASIEDLIAMKRTASRPRDLEDIDALLKLQHHDERRT